MKNNRLYGEVVSAGIAAGKIIKFQSYGKREKNFSFSDYSEEEKRFTEAVEKCEAEIKILKEEALKRLTQKEASIFDAHLMFLQDPLLIDETKILIKNKKISSIEALRERLEELEILFSQIDDPLFKNRWADLNDVGKRLIKILLEEDNKIISHNSEVILLTHEITPSDILSMADRVSGIIISTGAFNSHSSILARALKLPVIIQKDCHNILEEEEEIILNCQEGVIIREPDKNEIKDYKKIEIQVEKSSHKVQKTFTKDGVRIKLMANIIHSLEGEEVLKHGGEGVGIYRTEFSYLNHLPSEEELVIEYEKILETLYPLPVIFRTLDLGADKWPSYIPPQKESNPSLGIRGIRFSLQNADIFKTQVSAIIKANKKGNGKIIFPMITLLEDLEKGKEIVNKERGDINIDLGIMLETPASIISSDIFSNKVSFMSMGTNDLVQYNMAADRENEDTKEWYEAIHPAMLKLYRMAAIEGKKQKIPVSICGEIGGDSEIVPLLIGCGIKQFSMSPAKIPSVREKIRTLNYKDTKELAKKALNCRLIKEVKTLLEEFNNSLSKTNAL